VVVSVVTTGVVEGTSVVTEDNVVVAVDINNVIIRYNLKCDEEL
jgi:hypothetical protein